MLGKLLSLLVAGKGGSVAAAAIVAGATTVSVMTTSAEVQDAVAGIMSPGMSELAKAGRVHDNCERGQPVVVAQRNAADKLLRAAFQGEHKRLVDLRGGKDIDHQKANEILRTADRELRGVLTQALNDVAAQTLGREGQLKTSASPTATASPTASPTATPSPTATATATPTCTPKASATPTPTATATATPTGSPRSEERGRAAVAARVTLNASLAGIVDKAKADMKAIVDKAATELAALPAAEHGKSGEHGKPDATTQERGKSEGRKDAEHGRPSERPGGKPSPLPGRP